MEYKAIRFEIKPLDQNIFSAIAENVAQQLSIGRKNKSTQLRKFYDELIHWNEQVQQNSAEFEALLPFVKMMQAKVAYSKARGNTDDSFYDWFSHCLNEVKSPESLLYFKLHFEAVLGFYKQYDKKE